MLANEAQLPWFAYNAVAVGPSVKDHLQVQFEPAALWEN